MDAQALSSRIEAVTVFSSGAKITRVAELELEAGHWPERVRLSNLPLSLEDDSLRARIEPRGQASGAALPVAVDLRVELERSPVDEDLPPAVDEELERLFVEKRRLRALTEQNRAEEARLGALHQLIERPTPRKGDPPPPAPTAQRLVVLDLREREQERLLEERRNLETELKRVSQRWDDLDEQKFRNSNARQAREHELRKSVVLSLRPEDRQAGSAQLVLEYRVPGARWSAAYALELERSLNAGVLSLRALVCQGTGEDWNDVALTLSTATPEQWAELPELNSIRIGRRQAPPSRSGWRPLPDDAASLYSDYDRAHATLLGEAAHQEPDTTLGSLCSDDELSDVMALDDDVDGVAGAGEFLDASEVEFDLSEAPACAGPGADDVMEMMGACEEESFETLEAQAAPAAATDLRLETSVQTSVRAVSSHTPAPRLPSYGSVRMSGPDDPQRGSLAPVSAIGRTFELRLESQVHVQTYIRLLLGRALSEADKVAFLSLPTGHCEPRPDGHFDYSYPAQGRLSLASDGKFHSLAILSREAKTRSIYVCVPRESEDVFRAVELANPLPVALPPGPVDVSVAGEFLLSSRLDAVAPDGRTELGLGVEEAIKVARNTHYREETTGIMRGSQRFEHSIAIELVNHLQTAVQVEVRERIPVIQDGEEDTKVKLEKVTPDWEPYTPADQPTLEGGYCWHVEIPPAEALTLEANYAIELPAKLELVGGNRREG